MEERFWKDDPSHPPSPLWRSYLSDAVLGSACFFGPSLPHRSTRLQKNQPGRACCYRATPPPPPPVLSLRSHHHLHLYYYYYYYYYSATSDFITVPSPRSAPSPSPLPLQLLSSPEPFGRCVAARPSREERGRQTRGVHKNKKALLVCTGDSTLQTQRRREEAASFFVPPPTSYLIYGVPVHVPCMCLLYFFVS